MKVETVKFVSIWDVNGSDVIRDIDFGLTYGDGITLHTVRDVIDEVRWEESARTLINSLSRIADKYGDSFLLAF